MGMYEKGDLIIEGKTKKIFAEKTRQDTVIVESKDDITKNDDPSQTEVMSSKARFSTTTTSRVFELLQEAGIPTAYVEQIGPLEFVAQKCKMVPLEVIIRRYAVGSYLKRFPNLKKKEGEVPHRFHKLKFELFLKTTGGKITSKEGDVIGHIPKTSKDKPIDDPFILNHQDEIWELYHPKIPEWEIDSDLLCSVSRGEILPLGHAVSDIEKIARETFLALEGAWAQLGCRLIDFKIEFGIGPNGELLVADVIDNDSWRLKTSDWQELSKQLFRDNAEMEDIADKYALVVKLVNRFAIPKQAIVLWRGSDGDNLPYVPGLSGVERVEIVKSGHKSPGLCLPALENVLADYPEGGVILALVGMSNGLGPTLAARTSWPVIGVAMTAGDHPEDVWSSLRMPSQVPMATTLSPKNAVLMALNILAQKNPVAYMHRQYAIEQLDD